MPHFVDIMHMIATKVLTRARAPVPVLIDLNLYYRHLKLSYSKGCMRWKYREFFKYCPVIFGVWHSYKHACTLVYRRFLSQLVFLQHGTQSAGQNFPTAPRLRTLELVYAAILLLPQETRKALTEAVHDRQRTMEAAVKKVALHKRWAAATKNKGASSAAHTHNAAEQTRAEAALRTAEISLAHALAMERLVCLYVPALFVAGNEVRECHWEGRDMGSGAMARRAMVTCAIIMLSLCRTDAPGKEHLRDVCLALLFWQPWHGDLRGCMFSEEPCEASLSRLGEALRSNPHVTTVEGAQDLFLLVRPGAPGVKDVRSEGPTRDFVAMVDRNIRLFLSTTATVVTYVPWSRAKQCTTVRGVYSMADLPPPLGYLPPFEGLRALLGHYLHRMIQGGVQEVKTVTVLDKLIPHRGLVDRLDYEREVRQVKPMDVEFHQRVSRQDDDVAEGASRAQGNVGFRGGRWHRSRVDPHVAYSV